MSLNCLPHMLQIYIQYPLMYYYILIVSQRIRNVLKYNLFTAIH